MKIFGFLFLVSLADDEIRSRPVTSFEDRDIADVNKDLNLVHGDIMTDQINEKSESYLLVILVSYL